MGECCVLVCVMYELWQCECDECCDQQDCGCWYVLLCEYCEDYDWCVCGDYELWQVDVEEGLQLFDVVDDGQYYVVCVFVVELCGVECGDLVEQLCVQCGLYLVGCVLCKYCVVMIELCMQQYVGCCCYDGFVDVVCWCVGENQCQYVVEKYEVEDVDIYCEQFECDGCCYLLVQFCYYCLQLLVEIYVVFWLVFCCVFLDWIEVICVVCVW